MIATPPPLLGIIMITDSMVIFFHGFPKLINNNSFSICINPNAPIFAAIETKFEILTLVSAPEVP